jgi:hypothetical protein
MMNALGLRFLRLRGDDDAIDNAGSASQNKRTQEFYKHHEWNLGCTRTVNANVLSAVSSNLVEMSMPLYCNVGLQVFTRTTY